MLLLPRIGSCQLGLPIKKRGLALLPATWVVFALVLLSAGRAFAQETVAVTVVPALDTGDTAWMLTSTALVMLMTPGLALFYGGMVRKKNVLSSIMHSFVALAVIGIQWMIIGYSSLFRSGKYIHRRFYSFLSGRHYSRFTHRHHSYVCVHLVSGNVCHYHSGTDQRYHRRTNQIQHLCGILIDLGNHCL